MTVSLQPWSPNVTSLSPNTRTSNTDIASHFLQLVKRNITADEADGPPNPLPQALAVVAALTSTLEINALSTLAETLDLVSTLSTSLKDEFSQSGAEPLLAIPVSAGFEIFQKWLLGSGSSPSSAVSSLSSTPFLSRANTGTTLQDLTGNQLRLVQTPFEKDRAGFLTRAKSFVKEALQSRVRIAAAATKLFSMNSTVLVPAYDEVVEAVLLHAAGAGARFRVILVSEPSNANSSSHRTQASLAQRLRREQVPVAEVSPSNVAHALSTSDSTKVQKSLMLTGASALLSDGGILAAQGTQQTAILANYFKIALWVVAEEWKSVRWFPAQDLTRGRYTNGDQLHFSTGSITTSHNTTSASYLNLQPLDITPPSLIRSFITERGVMIPSALAEETVRTWF